MNKIDRISQILPTVKCSDCGEDVQIHQLGDHVCSTMPTMPFIPILRERTKPLNTPQPTQLPTPSISDWSRKNNSRSPAPFGAPAIPPASPQPRANVHEEPGSYFDDKKTPRSGGTRFGGEGALDILMADLKNTMGQDRDSNVSMCSGCQQPLGFRNIVSHGKEGFHANCYACRVCRVAFRHPQECFEHEGGFYCERDYSNIHRQSICAGCERPIASNVAPVKALGALYHPGHLECAHCYQPIDIERVGFKEYQGRVYCRPDYKRLFLPLCRACNQPVKGKAVSAMDGSLEGKWHVDCFGCHSCHESFPDNTFYVFENSPYCKIHYHQLNNSLCRTCDGPIEGPCAQTTEGWRFHPPCFVCNVCQCAITDIYYMFERRMYCESHIFQLQQQRNVRAEKRKTQFARV